MLWLGIDVGGTFTDLVLYDEATGALRVDKVPSTPQDNTQAILAGIGRLGLDLAQVGKLVHGTTVATNAALERKGARLAVITTRGFRDVLVVGRGNRTRLYDVKAVRPPPLLPRSAIHEVDERSCFDGTVLRALDSGALEAIAATLRAAGVDAVAICFLHSYANGDNERAAQALIEAALPDAFVCTSAEVLPEYREYERFATTALNAYVAPVISRYLRALAGRLAERGLTFPPEIMTSGGGAWPIGKVAQLPVHSMLSGPAGGVMAAVHAARAAGIADIITCDMGGTSTDACLIRNLEPPVTNEGMIGAIPNRVPQIEISTIGAGGGSIAALGPGRFLTVGPESAGADPGPACYGRGGTQPTVTDANVVLGRLRPDAPLGGTIRLDVAAAEAAVARLAGALGLDTIRMAEGIVQLAVTRMTGTIKEISIMRGHDPRGFVLFAYGGAGPLHAAMIAAELGIPRVIVPPLPGNFSAFGLLVADARHDYARTRLAPTAELSFDEVAAAFDAMREEARAELTAEGFTAGQMRFEARLDMRYVGQAFELPVELPADARSMADVDAAFYRAYERRYAFATPDPAEIVCFRLAGFGSGRKPPLFAGDAAAGTLEAARTGTRDAVFDAVGRPTPVYARERLPRDAAVQGPALIEEPGTTTVVPPGFSARADAAGHLVLERRGHA